MSKSGSGKSAAASSSSSSSSFNGIKRPQHIFIYKVKTDPDELPADWGALLSLLLGVVGLMMRNRIASWGAVFSCVYSVANLRQSESDAKQYMTNVMFAIMGLVMNYFGPAARRASGG